MGHDLIKPRPLTLGLVVTALALVAVSTPAAAAGNVPLSTRIVSSPVPGWAVTDSGSASAAADLQKQMKGTYTGKTLTAAKEWQAPGDASQYVNVSLVAYVGLPSSVHNQLLNGLKADINVACPGISGHPALTTKRVRSLGNGFWATCGNVKGFPADGAHRADVLLFAKANVLGFITLTSSNPDQVLQIATRQFAALSRNNFSG